jgi:hypothetical protein
MTDTLLILSIIIGLIAIVRPRRQPDLLSDDRDVFATNLIIMLSFLDSQDEIKALDAVYRTTKADLIRYGKTLDQGFLTQCLIITENYYQSCRTKLQLNGATDIASLN